MPILLSVAFIVKYYHRNIWCPKYKAMHPTVTVKQTNKLRIILVEKHWRILSIHAGTNLVPIFFYISELHTVYYDGISFMQYAWVQKLYHVHLANLCHSKSNIYTLSHFMCKALLNCFFGTWRTHDLGTQLINLSTLVYQVSYVAQIQN